MIGSYPSPTLNSVTLQTPIGVASGGTGATTATNAIANLGLGSLATQNADAVNITGGTITGITVASSGVPYGTDTGTANTYTVTTSPAVSALSDGTFVLFKAAHANTGAATLDVCGLGNVPITLDGSALASGDIAANGLYGVVYSSSSAAWLLLAPASTSGGSTSYPLSAIPFGATFPNSGSPTETAAVTAGTFIAPSAGVIVVDALWGGNTAAPSANTISASGVSFTTLFAQTDYLHAFTRSYATVTAGQSVTLNASNATSAQYSAISVSGTFYPGAQTPSVFGATSPSSGSTAATATVTAGTFIAPSAGVIVVDALWGGNTAAPSANTISASGVSFTTLFAQTAMYFAFTRSYATVTAGQSVTLNASNATSAQYSAISVSGTFYPGAQTPSVFGATSPSSGSTAATATVTAGTFIAPSAGVLVVDAAWGGSVNSPNTNTISASGVSFTTLFAQTDYLHAFTRSYATVTAGQSVTLNASNATSVQYSAISVSGTFYPDVS